MTPVGQMVEPSRTRARVGMFQFFPKKIKVQLAFLFALVPGLFSGVASAQCSMCKTALSESIEGQVIAEGINRAILLLFALPALLVGTVAVLVWRNAVNNQTPRVPPEELLPTNDSLSS